MATSDWSPQEVKAKHVREAAKIWRRDGGFQNFRQSIRYDVMIDDMPYPPKAISSIAHMLATSRSINANDFGGAREGIWHKRLTQLGFPIRQKGSGNVWIDPSEWPDYSEGEPISVTVNKYERDPRARKKCIAHYGAKCCVCDLSFEKRYGPQLGAGFIHVHHLVSLGSIQKAYKVNPIKDLVPVCPNCHAMLHKGKLTPSELRNALQE